MLNQSVRLECRRSWVRGRVMPKTSLRGVRYYEDRTRGLSDETLNRGPVYRCFTPSTLKKGSLYPSFTLLSFMDIWVYWPVYSTNNTIFLIITQCAKRLKIEIAAAFPFEVYSVLFFGDTLFTVLYLNNRNCHVVEPATCE